MEKILEILIKNKIAVFIGILILTYLGISSFYKMPVDLFPEIKIPVINIVTHYPGASSKDIEILVSKPIEDKMLSLQGVKRVSSSSFQDISTVTVEFKWGTPIFQARQLVLSALGEVKSKLPSGVEPIIDSIGTRLQNVYGFIIYGQSDISKLYNITKYKLAGRLMEINGVSSVQILGGKKQAIYIKVNPFKLKQFHISISDIKNALKGNNYNIVAGYINKSNKEYILRGIGKLKSLKDIKSIIIKNGNPPIFLGDIAEVSKGYAPSHYIVHGDNHPAIAVIVRKQPGASTIKVAEEIENSLKNFKKLYPEGTKFKKFYDQSEIIKESRNEIINDLIIGSILVFLILWLFLGNLKPTFIVTATIPITFLGTLYCMYRYGLGLNVITMTALVLAIGMIVDDAIVVTENIYRHSLDNPNSLKASIDGAVEIAGPDASGTFTTVAAFLPLVIVGGILSVFFKPFGFTISVALIVSLILSLTLVPVLFSTCKIKKIEDTYLGFKIIRWIRNIIVKILNFSLKHKFLSFSFFTIIFLFSIFTLFYAKFNVLPPIDEGAILIEYVMPPGVSLKESDRIGKIIDSIALSDPDVYSVYRRTGSPEVGFQTEGVNRGEILIKLKPKSVRKRNVNEIISDLRKAYSKLNGIVFLYHQPTQEKIDESFSGLPALFGVTIYGNNVEKLIELSKKVEKLMNSVNGINNVINNVKIKIPQIEIKLKRDKMAQFNVSAENIFNTVKAANWGIIATEILKNNINIPVYIKLLTAKDLTIEDLKNLTVINNHGDVIPLKKVAKIEISYLPEAIYHLNGLREVTLISDIEGNIPQIVNKLKKKLEKLHLPEGYSISFTGQYKVMINSAIELGLACIIAIILIFLIMGMQFNSFKQPLIILMVLPFTVSGSLILLFLTKTPVDISAGMGIITLIGIGVNNGIVLVDYFNRMVKKGMEVKKALFEAVGVRLRPIILTSATTISALIPTAIGTTIGSHIFQGFAITVIGGLITGMLATLIIVPLLLGNTDKKVEG